MEQVLVVGGEQRDSNPRPSLEPQSTDIRFWRLPRMAEPAYLGHFLCSRLRLVSAYCAFSGVRSGTGVDASGWVQMSWCLPDRDLCWRSGEIVAIGRVGGSSFAGCGITGPVLAELPYDSGDEHGAGGGNIMINPVGRTVASGDAVHAVAPFVINDEGAWMLKRPQDYPRTEIAELARAGRGHEFVRLYERSRVRIAAGRPDVPRVLPFVMPFNKWAANV